MSTGSVHRVRKGDLDHFRSDPIAKLVQTPLDNVRVGSMVYVFTKEELLHTIKVAMAGAGSRIGLPHVNTWEMQEQLDNRTFVEDLLPTK